MISLSLQPSRAYRKTLRWVGRVIVCHKTTVVHEYWRRARARVALDHQERSRQTQSNTSSMLNPTLI